MEPGPDAVSVTSRVQALAVTCGSLYFARGALFAQVGGRGGGVWPPRVLARHPPSKLSHRSIEGGGSCSERAPRESRAWLVCMRKPSSASR